MNSSERRLSLDAINFSPDLLVSPSPLPASQPLLLGQTTAADMLRLGIAMQTHILVVGATGSRRKKLVTSLITQPTDSLGRDILLLFNYADPSRPLVLEVPTGDGIVIKQAFAQFEKSLREALLNTYQSAELRLAQQALVQQSDKAVRELWIEFISPLADEDLQLALSADQGTPEIQLVWDDQAYPFIALISTLKSVDLTSERWLKLKHSYDAQRVMLDQLMVRIETLTRQTSKTLHTLIKDHLSPLINQHCSHLISQFVCYPLITTCVLVFETQLTTQLQSLPISIFEETDTLIGWVWAWHNPHLLHTHNLASPALFYEADPTWTHLFGSVEIKEELSLTSIQGGSLLSMAHGYLMLDLEKILHDEELWFTLKLALTTGRLTLQNSPSASPLPGHFNTISVPLTTRLIFLSPPELYEKLSELGDDLLTLCPVVVEFDDMVAINGQTVADYTAYLISYALKQNFPRPTPMAISALLHQTMMHSEHRGFFTSQLQQLDHLLALAQNEAKTQSITAEHVATAINVQQQRIATPIKEILRSIHNKQLRINPTGKAVGKVQALVVMDHGQMSFGCPTLITATVSAGKDGLINIEREVDLSGDLHDKGVFILEAVLRSLFAKTTPLSVTMSLCFEQSYAHVEGDSATLAEACALVSVLSATPLKQSIGITGSMNQLGELQPIGGLNEKIIGFFTVCQSLGLTGEQGVIFPANNMPNLMLPPHVLSAIEQGKFHLWACHHLFEALELLTDLPIGEPNKQGKYPKNSLFWKVDETLKTLGS